MSMLHWLAVVDTLRNIGQRTVEDVYPFNSGKLDQKSLPDFTSHILPIVAYAGILHMDPQRDIHGSAPTQTSGVPSNSPRTSSPWKHLLVVVTATFAALLAYSFPNAFERPPALESDFSEGYTFADTILSNGTHEFGRTVVLVSLDGFRSDYLDKGLTPHLVNISRSGVRAEYMKPIFPTLTFPNHWTLMTGLYAESHGVVANDFYDPQSRSTFAYNRPGTEESQWWLGEPMWETVERAGFRSANIMWPGPRTTTSGITPSYRMSFKPLCPPEEKIAQVLEWIDLSLEERPRLIVVYEPMLDQAGHAAGPESELVDKTLPTISEFAHTLVQSLHSERNLSHIVDLLFVSDHGMEDTSSWEMVYMDDILCSRGDAGEQGWPACAGVEHVDGWPSMGLWFEPGVSATEALSRLILASESRQFDVYASDTYTHDKDSSVVVPRMPKRYHYSASQRLAPLWVVPRVGYALTDRVENGTLMSIGNHGYDNDEATMRAIFIAQGPFADSVRKWFREDSEWNQEYVLPPFQNVELYHLVVWLLGIEGWAPETNGTSGFWDKWIGGP